MPVSNPASFRLPERCLLSAIHAHLQQPQPVALEHGVLAHMGDTALHQAAWGEGGPHATQQNSSEAGLRMTSSPVRCGSGENLGSAVKARSGQPLTHGPHWTQALSRKAGASPGLRRAPVGQSWPQAWQSVQCLASMVMVPSGASSASDTVVWRSGRWRARWESAARSSPRLSRALASRSRSAAGQGLTSPLQSRSRGLLTRRTRSGASTGDLPQEPVGAHDPARPRARWGSERPGF